MDAAQTMTAELVALRAVLAALLEELLDGADDRRAAAEMIMHRAIKAADALALEGATADDVAVMRDAMRQRIATLVLRDAASHRRRWWPAATALR